ncbi:hypothetical protein HN51_003312 [Arachis hypogaea]
MAFLAKEAAIMRSFSRSDQTILAFRRSILTNLLREITSNTSSSLTIKFSISNASTASLGKRNGSDGKEFSGSILAIMNLRGFRKMSLSRMIRSEYAEKVEETREAGEEDIAAFEFDEKAKGGSKSHDGGISPKVSI